MIQEQEGGIRIVLLLRGAQPACKIVSGIYSGFELVVNVYCKLKAGVSNCLVSLQHTGRRRVVLGHTLNTS